MKWCHYNSAMQVTYRCAGAKNMSYQVSSLSIEAETTYVLTRSWYQRERRVWLRTST
jgi:hypothetical protein